MTEHPITEQMLAQKNATGHSIWGPSSAHRWMRCPASLIQGHLAGDRPTYYAAEGSVAHWIGETWLTHGSWAVNAEIGKVHTKDGFEIEITEEMISYVEEYVEICSTVQGCRESFVEVKVDLSDYTPAPSFGTSDWIGVEWQKLRVKDLKYGKVWVDPDDNEQGMAYALGAFRKYDWLYDFQEIEIQIVQPRRENYGVWTIDRARLLEFGEQYREAAHAAWNPNADYNPDPVACEYCPARTTCPALFAVKKQIAADSFDDDDGALVMSPSTAVAEASREMISTPVLPDYRDVPLERLAKLYEWRPILERYFREMYDYLLKQLELDRDVPGQKLGIGRPGNRAWKDSTGARKLMRSMGISDLDIYNSKMIGPAEAERLLRLVAGGTKKANAARIAPFVTQSPGKVTMISSVDKRESIASAASAFDDDVDSIGNS